jgi:hypothetical protein
MSNLLHSSDIDNMVSNPVLLLHIASDTMSIDKYAHIYIPLLMPSTYCWHALDRGLEKHGILYQKCVDL